MGTGEGLYVHHRNPASVLVFAFLRPYGEVQPEPEALLFDNDLVPQLVSLAEQFYQQARVADGLHAILAAYVSGIAFQVVRIPTAAYRPVELPRIKARIRRGSTNLPPPTTVRNMPMIRFFIMFLDLIVCKDTTFC